MILTIGAGGAAFAHANYLRSEPAPNAHLATAPARVLVGFSEKVELASSSLVLIDQSGHDVATRSQPTTDPTELALPLPALVDGVYTVAWRTVSAEDGDRAQGYFAFEVGAVSFIPGPPVTRSKSTADGIAVALAVSPDRAGKNGYVVTLTRGGAAVADVTRVRLRFTPLDRDIGQTDLVFAAASAGPGVFAGSGFELPMAGRYRVEVQLRRSGLEDATVELDLTVASADASPSPAPTGVPSAASSATQAAAPATGAPATPSWLLGVGLLVLFALGAVVAGARRRS